MVKSIFTVPIGATFTRLTPSVHLDMIYWCHVVVCVLDLHFTLEWLTMVRKKWLCQYYSTYWCYIHQTCTNCSSWHDLLMPHGGLCPWPSFHAWVTMVRKKWLSLYYSTYWCYIHQTCTNCSSWHDLLMPHGCLCPWPIFHAWVTMVKKTWLSLYYSTYWCYIHQTCTNCSSGHDLLMPHGCLCPWPTFHASVTKTQNGNSGASVMVPIRIMSS